MFKKTISTVTIIAMVSGNALALPQGSNVINGNVNIDSNANTMNINQTTNRAEIHWNSFDVNKHETVNFNSLNRSDITINKVVGGSPSLIQGMLNSNHTVAILNEYGMTITKDAKLNMGAFIASTARNYRLERNPYGPGDRLILSNLGNGEIKNYGIITMKDDGKGHAFLFANKVENHGDITANNGSVHLASGKTAYITLSDGFEYPVDFLNIEQNTELLEGSGVTNTGNLTAKSGLIQLSTRQKNDIRAGAINLSGVLDASSLNGGTLEDAGDVIIQSTGNINNSAKISATDTNGGVNSVAHLTNNFNGTADTSKFFMYGGDVSYTGNVTGVKNDFTVVSNNDLKIVDAAELAELKLNHDNQNNNIILANAKLKENYSNSMKDYQNAVNHLKRAVRKDNKNSIKAARNKKELALNNLKLAQAKLNNNTQQTKAYVAPINTISTAEITNVSKTAENIGLVGKNVSVGNIRGTGDLAVSSNLNIGASNYDYTTHKTNLGDIAMVNKSNTLKSDHGEVSLYGNNIDVGNITSNSKISINAQNSISANHLNLQNNILNEGNVARIEVKSDPYRYRYDAKNPNKISINKVTMDNYNRVRMMDMNGNELPIPNNTPALNLFSVEGRNSDVKVGDINMYARSNAIDPYENISAENQVYIQGYNINAANTTLKTVADAPNSLASSSIYYEGRNINAGNTVINTSNPNYESGYTYSTYNATNEIRTGAHIINYNYTGN